jgi:carbonic anhydrase
MRNPLVALASPRLSTLALRALVMSALGACVVVTAGAEPAARPASQPKAQPDAQATGQKSEMPGGKPPAPAAAASAPRGPRQDPLDVLRDRLAARLGAKPAPVADAAVARAVLVSSKATGEFQVPANALAKSGRAKRSAGPTEAAGAAAHAGSGTAPHADPAHAAWGYEGANGPQQWARLKPEFSLCARGQRQSPIDIRDGFAVELEPVVFDYRPSGFQVVNSGHSLQADMAPGNRLEVSGRSFELVQFHFHNPAEERIDGRSFVMSGHLVHKDAEGRLAVVTVLFEHGQANPIVQTVWNHLPLDRGVAESGRIQLNPADLLPSDRRYYTYMGSLTTPPCTEGVQWVVLKQPVTLSPAQHEFFARLYPMNARPVQSASGRIIKQSQ